MEVIPSEGVAAKRKTAPAFLGTWRIVEMEVWDQAAFDDLGPAHFTFGEESLGNFRFIAVEGGMDCRFGDKDGKPLVEFSWTGVDDNDSASGRGWAVIDGDKMTGRIFIHCGDDSAFTAERQNAAGPTKARRGKERGR